VRWLDRLQPTTVQAITLQTRGLLALSNKETHHAHV
jgi:hypothetical protein